MFHPACTLDLQFVQIHLGFDGAFYVSPHSHVYGPDGVKAHTGHSHGHRISPHDPRWRMIALAVAPAFLEQHDVLGLTRPQDDSAALPLHFHPQGHPGFVLPPEPHTAQLSAAEVDALRTHIVAHKEGEYRETADGRPVTIPREQHPLQDQEG